MNYAKGGKEGKQYGGNVKAESKLESIKEPKGELSMGYSSTPIEREYLKDADALIKARVKRNS